MRKIAMLGFALGLVAAACGGSSDSEDEVVVLEEGVHTATLEVTFTHDWQSVIWEEGRGFLVRFDVVESSEKIRSANITLWWNSTDFSIVFRDSSMPVIVESGEVGVTQLYPLDLELTDEQRQEVLALSVGDVITIRYNKVVSPADFANVSDEPEISVDDYHFGSETYIKLDEALSWRGDHSRVNVRIFLAQDQ